MALSEFNPVWTATLADDVEKIGIFAGCEADGKKIYVGRVAIGAGMFIPAKIVPQYKQSFFERDGREHSSPKFEYLSNSNNYDWIKSSDGAIVDNAVTIGGFYVGRGVWNGNIVVGRVDLKTKQLVSSINGNVLTLTEYDVLTGGSQDDANENTQQRVPSFALFTEQKVNKVISTTIEKNHQGDRTVFRETHLNGNFNREHNLEMLNKIQTLELELSTYKHDRETYENRIEFEQNRVQDLSNKLKALRLENSAFIKERITWKERITTETTLVSEIESKLQGVLIDNAFLLKKVTSLEDALKYERNQIAIFNEKYQRDISSGSSLQVKIQNFEETVRNQQQRILDLEGALENINSGSSSLSNQVKTYEINISNMKLQIDGLMKKLQSSNADNDFLVQKLSMLTQSLKAYQSQLEAMSRKLQNAKIIIATANGELSRANGQISKYQAALSQCYILNGELMTKVSGFSSMSQFQAQYDSKFDILNLNHELSLGATGSNSTNFNSTSMLMEAAGSDSYVSFVKNNGTESESSVGSQPGSFI